MRKILIIDDDKDFVQSLERILGEEYAIESADTPEKARKIFSPLKYDVVLLDICFDPRTKDQQGIEVLREFKKDDPDIPIIMMTAYSDIDTAVETLKLGAEDYIQKHKATLSDYKNRIDYLFREGRLRRKVSRLQQEIEKYEPSEIIGDDKKMLEVKNQIRLVAQEGQATVLIRGETGTGKELVARAIHKEGVRRDNPYVVVPLAALNKETIGSDIFGHEKGAYTGAIGRRIGYIEEADGGILFIDEIGDLDNDIQIKLLRVLENREFMRMGSNKVIRVDIQLIAATHQDLEMLIDKGAFRRDLYYRLKVYEIFLPPLRERKGDIPLLAQHFFDLLKKQGRNPLKGISDEAMAKLITYQWPGNVRELKHMIENSVLNARLQGDEIITLKHLKQFQSHDEPKIDTEIRSQKSEDRIEHAVNTEQESIIKKLAIYELRLVRDALIRSGGKKADVSRILGYSDRFALRRRILAIFKKFPELQNEFQDVQKKFARSQTAGS